MNKHKLLGLYILIVALGFGALIADTFIRTELHNRNGHIVISDSTKGLLKVKTNKNGLADISINKDFSSNYQSNQPALGRSVKNLGNI